MTDPVTPKEALGVPARPVTEKGLEGLYALPLDVIDARTVAAREYLAFLEGPTDEDVQVLADFDFVLWDRDQFDNITGEWHYATPDEFRAALLAVAEARRQR